MLQNQLVQALRSLKKQRFYSLINVFGLTVSLFSVIVLGLYIWHEWSFDRFHEKQEKIYRIFEENSNRQFAVTPYAWRDTMLEEFSEVSDITRVQTIASIFTLGEKVFSETNGIAVDSSFLNVFSFQVLKGNNKELFSDPNEIAITPALATKYFGEMDPIGQLIEINLFGESESFSVNGIIECPGNSHLQFDYVLPFERVIANNPNKSAYENWAVHFLFTYVLVNQEIDVHNMKVKLKEFLQRHKGESLFAKYSPQFEPLNEIYLHSVKEFDVLEKGSMANLKILGLVALAILFIGVINFINLTTARAFTRMKNASIRKVYGSSKIQLINQFLIEGYLILALSIILALGLIQILNGSIEQLSGKDLSLGLWFNPYTLTILGALWLILGFFMGIYPGWIIASFKPLQLLKTKSNKSQSQILGRKILSVFQVASAAMLIIGTLIMWLQVEYMGSKSLGYGKDQLLVINDGGLIASDPIKFETFRNRLLNEPYFGDMSALSSYPGTNSHWSSRYFLAGDDASTSTSITTFFADQNFVSTLGLEIESGRDFDKTRPTDSLNFIVNQACIDFFAEKDSMWATDPFSQVLDWRFRKRKGKVVGIVKNFHFESLKNEIRPIIITEHLPFTSFIGLKLVGRDYRSITSDLETIWIEMFPKIPFEYSFADETFNNTFQAELRLGRLFMIFASLAIFIAMLGLLGLAASSAHEKTKEIGIRKVVGAGKSSIILLLIRQFVWIIIIANAVAIPISYIFSNKWLDGFSYRIDWPIGVVFVSFGITIVITLGTIFFHALKTSSINPVKALMNE